MSLLEAEAMGVLAAFWRPEILQGLHCGTKRSDGEASHEGGLRLSVMRKTSTSLSDLLIQGLSSPLRPPTSSNSHIIMLMQ